MAKCKRKCQKCITKSVYRLSSSSVCLTGVFDDYLYTVHMQSLAYLHLNVPKTKKKTKKTEKKVMKLIRNGTQTNSHRICATTFDDKMFNTTLIVWLDTLIDASMQKIGRFDCSIYCREFNLSKIRENFIINFKNMRKILSKWSFDTSNKKI